MRCGSGLRMLSAAVAALFFSAVAPASRALEKFDQGRNWSEAAQKDFYTRDQGSRLIPWAWISALKQANGKPFMADSLDRYGYSPNPESSPPGLPVGWVVASQDRTDVLGLTCSACHTRQIEVHGKAYRIDGGPAIADLGSFWRDLDTAVAKILSDPASFDDFAHAVLGARCASREAGGAAKTGRGLAGARARHRRRRIAEAAALGTGAHRRRRHDLEPRGRARCRPAAELSDPARISRSPTRPFGRRFCGTPASRTRRSGRASPTMATGFWGSRAISARSTASSASCIRTATRRICSDSISTMTRRRISRGC